MPTAGHCKRWVPVGTSKSGGARYGLGAAPPQRRRLAGFMLRPRVKYVSLGA